MAKLARLLEAAVHPSALRHWRYLDLVRAVLDQAVERFRYRLSGESPYVLARRPGARIAAVQKFKGVERERRP